jgi:hypothetical protein
MVRTGGGDGRLEEMKRTRVKSSGVNSIGYDAAKRALEVEFAGGRVYRYQDVPPEVFDELERAESKGIYVNLVIKPNYPFDEVETEKEV